VTDLLPVMCSIVSDLDPPCYRPLPPHPPLALAARGCHCQSADLLLPLVMSPHCVIHLSTTTAAWQRGGVLTAVLPAPSLLSRPTARVRLRPGQPVAIKTYRINKRPSPKN
jgi:hypothetical protein